MNRYTVERILLFWVMLYFRRWFQDVETTLLQVTEVCARRTLKGASKCDIMRNASLIQLFGRKLNVSFQVSQGIEEAVGERLFSRARAVAHQDQSTGG